MSNYDRARESVEHKWRIFRVQQHARALSQNVGRCPPMSWNATERGASGNVTAA
jgi:hypothetical protein